MTVLSELNIVSLDVWYAFWSFFCFVYSMYCLGWILCANKEAMQLLLKQFVFWFKLCYLILYLGSNAVVQSVREDPFHYICTSRLFAFAFLFLVMIFDALNIIQSSKIIISSFALGGFAHNTLYNLQIGFYRTEFDIYTQCTVTFPDWFGVGSMQLNIIDTAANSSQILAIFLMKQMISSFRNPTQASVIERTPFLIYENKGKNVPNRKTIRNWKRITVLYWAFVLLLYVLFAINDDNITNRVLIIFVFCEFLLICLFVKGKQTFLWIGNVFVFVMIIVYGIGVFLFKFWSGVIFLLFIGFGISVTYALKVCCENLCIVTLLFSV